MNSLRMTRLAGICEKLREYGNVFRGCSDSNYQLVPTVGRLPHTSIQLEQELLGQFSAHIEGGLDGKLSAWDRLVLAQHYGIPTRLLDWTLNPFVALFFAARRAKDVDFAVFVADVTVLEEEPRSSPFEIKESMFFKPRIFDARIQHQESVFSIQTDPASTLPLQGLSHLTFPATCRAEALALSAEHGVTAEHLFPVGLTSGWTSSRRT